MSCSLHLCCNTIVVYQTVVLKFVTSPSLLPYHRGLGVDAYALFFTFIGDIVKWTNNICEENLKSFIIILWPLLYY